MLQSILVIKLGALGDIFLALDVFHALRVHHAGERLVLLTRPAFTALGAKMPWFQEVWTDSGPKLWQVGQWLALRRRLRAGQFARVYDLQCNDRTGFYFRLLGRDRPEWSGAARGCSHPRPDFTGQRLHTAERLFRQVEVTGVQRAGRADLSWLDGPVEDFNLPARFVVLVPSCAAHRPNKRWPARSYAQLADRLSAHGVGVVAVGTHVDREALNTLVTLAPHVVSLAGQTDIGQLVALARRAVAVVGNDTGPVHLMATVGAPTLVLMSGESDPVTMLPNGPEVGWLQRDALTELGVEEVWSGLQARWPLFATQAGPATPPPLG